jgi:predicted ester cyclase
MSWRASTSASAPTTWTRRSHASHANASRSDCLGLDNPAHHAAALALKKAMPDCHMEVVRILEMDDPIYVTGRFKGTHTGDLSTPLGPVAASGKALDLLFVDYFRVANGKIVECEVVRDPLGMMIQLGAVPEK